MEKLGGEDAYLGIKYMVPTYESCVFNWLKNIKFNASSFTSWSGVASLDLLRFCARLHLLLCHLQIQCLVVIVSLYLLLPFSLFISYFAELLCYHFHLVHVMFVNVILSPLFKLAELAPFNVHCPLFVHKDSLIDLLVVKRIWLHDQAIRVL